jgi:predicted RNA binding protein YcfA (HicA-like mRNA interferase family)
MASEQRFADVRRELERHGWTLARIQGSHHIFERPGKGILVIPVHHGKVKPVYVRRIQKTIEGD